MVLPRFVQAALDNRPLVVHDDGKQARCFAHVDDVIEAIVTLAETQEAFGRVFNIGSDQDITILELAKRVIERVGSSSTIEYDYAQAYDESFEDIRRRVPDLSRIQQTIGFRAKKDLNAIIDSVALYLRS